MLKRYLVFGNYGSKGGWNDFINSFETLEHIQSYFKVNEYNNYQQSNGCDYEWLQVIDSTTLEKVNVTYNNLSDL